MEVKFDIVRPNLYMVGDEVYFGIDSSDIIPVSRSVDKIIEKQIGVLKVKKTNLEVADFGKSRTTEKVYDTPLRRYLDIREEQFKVGKIAGITNNAAKLFDLGYLIDAQTVENGKDMNDWRLLQHDLANPDEDFDRFERNFLFYKLDREKTLKEMKKLYEELDQKTPDNYAEFVVVNGDIPFSEHEIKTQHLGVVSFVQLKAKDKTKIEEAKIDLVERLKEVDGPCLSFDAPRIYKQMIGLYLNASELIQNYGDILKSPMWQTRLFRLDP